MFTAIVNAASDERLEVPKSEQDHRFSKDPDGFHNGLYRAINPKVAAVNAEIIAGGLSPFFVGVIIVVAGTALVRF